MSKDYWAKLAAAGLGMFLTIAIAKRSWWYVGGAALIFFICFLFWRETST